MFDPHGFAPSRPASSADRPQAGPPASTRPPVRSSVQTAKSNPHAHNTRIHHQPSHGEGLGPHGTLATHQASLPHGHTCRLSHQRLNPHQLPHGQAQARPQQPTYSPRDSDEPAPSPPTITPHSLTLAYSDRQTLQLLSSPSHSITSPSLTFDRFKFLGSPTDLSSTWESELSASTIAPRSPTFDRFQSSSWPADLSSAAQPEGSHEQSSLLSSQSTGSFNPAPIDLPTSPSATCQALVNSNHTSLAPRQPGAVNSAPSTTSAPSQPQPVAKVRAILANQKEAQSKAKKAAKASAQTAAKKDAARIEAAPNQSTPHEANRQQVGYLQLGQGWPPTQIDTPLPPLEDELDFSSFDPPLPPQPEPPAHHDAELNDSMIDTQAFQYYSSLWNTSDHVALPAVGKGKAEETTGRYSEKAGDHGTRRAAFTLP
ncbi:hypothetical protein KEM48_013413 [Puccinia striiformis f. sp. tritici PST-130]|nr:hypothetical protein KEM48_013413 [Puccinia striiformis f. sp. tritici PST-130]